MAPLQSTTHLADTSPFDLSGSTWGGDMLLNSSYNFGVNGQGQYDLFTVALHEAAHSFGFADQTTDPSSATYAIYNGVRTGLGAADVAALQSLYGGQRAPDLGGNNSLGSATALSRRSSTATPPDPKVIAGPKTGSFFTPSSSSRPKRRSTIACMTTPSKRASGRRKELRRPPKPSLEEWTPGTLSRSRPRGDSRRRSCDPTSTRFGWKVEFKRGFFAARSISPAHPAGTIT